MKAVGIIVEYNPFHNGHLYHLNKVREKYSDHVIIAIMSGNYVQRGEVSLISKLDKTKLALYFGVDIVLDLPFVYATESADFFAFNSIKVLNHFQVDIIVFGSESNNIDMYYEAANIQLFDERYNILVKQELSNGFNYPTACSRALKLMGKAEVNLPNDILGLAYTKAIIKNNYNIQVDVIKRTNDFHSLEIAEVASATSIRNAVLQSEDFKIAVPKYTYETINNSITLNNDDYFDYLKYKIVTTPAKTLANIHLVDEGIEYKIKSEISLVSNYDELVKSVASKRYTYSRINRILLNVLMNYTKTERKNVENNNYNRVLGFSKKGRVYLKYLKELGVEYDVNFKNIDNTVSKLEKRASLLYNLKNYDYRENFEVVRNENN